METFRAAVWQMTADERPKWVYLDGHHSHFDPEAMTYALDHKVYLNFLKANDSIHDAAIDNGANAKLKTAWPLVDCYENSSLNHMVNKERFKTTASISSIFTTDGQDCARNSSSSSSASEDKLVKIKEARPGTEEYGIIIKGASYKFFNTSFLKPVFATSTVWIHAAGGYQTPPQEDVPITSWQPKYKRRKKEKNSWKRRRSLASAIGIAKNLKRTLKIERF
mmetsp:Transcript_30211/g.56180  ORF Transcript_30211/g.56180 Transcript_30211/m.56180 type:complete len:222 (+) Transcript_30211:361-1026(+)